LAFADAASSILFHSSSSAVEHHSLRLLSNEPLPCRLHLTVSSPALPSAPPRHSTQKLSRRGEERKIQTSWPCPSEARARGTCVEAQPAILLCLSEGNKGRQRLTCCWLFGIVTEIVLVPRYNISDGMCYIHAATVCWPVASVQAKTTVPSTSVEPAALESDHALFLSPRSWSRVQTSQRRHHADGSGDLAAVGGPRRNHRHHPLHRLSLITRCPVGSMSSVPASSSASYNFVSIV
jgi:hypothetical protein